MLSNFYSTHSSSGSRHFNTLDPCSRSLENGNRVSKCGSVVSEALVLDNEKCELVKAPVVGAGKKEVSEAKALAVLKSHSEAEKRRRDRINAHLATLRGLVPCTKKVDKASLLAQVIDQLKQLKTKAIEDSKGLLIPMDDDEVKVEAYDNGGGEEDGTLSFKASLCCGYRPELLYDIKQVIDAQQLRMVDAQISTLGGRLKNVLFLTACRNQNAVDDAEAQKLIADSIQEALNGVLEKGEISGEYSPRTTLTNKRRRVSCLDSFSSSC